MIRRNYSKDNSSGGPVAKTLQQIRWWKAPAEVIFYEVFLSEAPSAPSIKEFHVKGSEEVLCVEVDTDSFHMFLHSFRSNLDMSQRSQSAMEEAVIVFIRVLSDFDSDLNR